MANWVGKKRVAFRDHRLSKERKSDIARSDITVAGFTTVAGFLGVEAGYVQPLVQAHPVLQVGCAIGAIGVALRSGIYIDMYATKRLEEGSANRFVVLTEKALRKTPYRYLSSIKLMAGKARQSHLDYIGNLQAQKKDRPEDTVALNNDINVINKISHFVDPFMNLKIGMIAGLGLGVACVQQIVLLEQLAYTNSMVAVAVRTLGIAASFIYAAGQIGAFTTRRRAVGDTNYGIHPLHKWLLVNGHNAIMATPVRYVSWLILRWQQSRIKDVSVSPQSQEYLDSSGLSHQLKVITEAISSPSRLKTVGYTSSPSALTPV